MLIRHPVSARANDLYETPEVATLSLLAVEPLPPRILEPACGRGAITRVLRGAGHIVIENDIVDYGQGQDSVHDFLDLKPAKVGEIDAVVTNPPYRLAHQFVRHALTFCPRVIMLLRLTFLESERRRDVLDEAGLVRIHVFSDRLPMMHRDGWAGNIASNAVAFAWFVWQREHIGKATIDRISWKRGAFPRQSAHIASELRRSSRHLDRRLADVDEILGAMRKERRCAFNTKIGSCFGH